MRIVDRVTTMVGREPSLRSIFLQRPLFDPRRLKADRPKTAPRQRFNILRYPTAFNHPAFLLYLHAMLLRR